MGEDEFDVRLMTSGGVNLVNRPLWSVFTVDPSQRGLLMPLEAMRFNQKTRYKTCEWTMAS